MADFSPPWAASGTRRAPTASEQSIGFQCGAADPRLFNYLFHRIQSEIDAVIVGGGLTPSDSQLNQMWMAIKGYVDAQIDEIETGGEVDLSNYYTKTQSDARYYLKSAVDSMISAIRQVPVGQIAPFGRSAAPTGWLKCNGGAVSRTAYADLFAEIGTSFGSGNGSTTFNVPDLRGEFVRGWADNRSVDDDRELGSFQAGTRDQHYHLTGQFKGAPGTNEVDDVFLITRSGDPGASYGARRVDAYATTSSAETATIPDNDLDALTGTSAAIPTGEAAVPRNVALLYCIKF